MASSGGHQPGAGATGGGGGDAGDFINTSDYFNSKGELQISEMSQFPSELDSTGEADASTSYDEIKQGQEPVKSTANTAEKSKNSSKSQEGAEPQKSKASPKPSDFSIADLVEKYANTSSSSSSCGHAHGKGKKCRDKKCVSKPTSAPPQPLAQLNKDNFQGFVHMLPKHLTPKFNPSATSSPNYPTGLSSSVTSTPPSGAPTTNSTTSVTSGLTGPLARAPNFRLKEPGEEEIKDPPLGPLSDSEIQNETRRLYEMDRAERELEGLRGVLGNSGLKLPSSPASVVRNLFNSSNPTPLNMLPSVESLAIPTLNDGLDDLMNYYIHKHKVRPLQPNPTPSTQPLAPATSELPKPQPVEVNEPKAVRSKGFVLGDQPKANEPLPSAADVVARCLPQRQTKNKILSPPKSKAVNLKELDQLWKDIQETKAKMDQDIEARLKQQSSSAPQLLEVSPRNEVASSSSKTAAPKQSAPARGKQLPRSRGKKQGKKPKSKPGTGGSSSVQSATQNQAKAAGGDSKGKGANSLDFIRGGLEQSSEFSTLLQMAQLDESTLLENLLMDDMNDLDYSEFEDYQLPPEGEEQEAPEGAEKKDGGEGDNEEDDDTEECDSELSAALANVQLRDWLRSDPQHVIYYEKYCQEKYKREYCEKEIMDLQKQLLETKEQVAGLDGILLVKTKSGVKYQKLWEGLIKKWRQHEEECASKIDNLEKKNTELSKVVESQITKTKEYEEELSKTVGLVEEFKERMEGMRKEFDAELHDWKCKMGYVQQDLNTVTGHWHKEKKEKESVKKALGEAQDVVEKLETTNKTQSDKLQVTEEKLKSNSQQIDQLNQEKEQLVSEVEKEQEEKQVLERRLRAEFKEQTRKEAERLHTYYNDKVREILKSESEKMTLAETEFIAAHEQEVKLLNDKHEDQMQEMKHHFENQISNLKLYYKMEIGNLKKESQEKGKLIETVARELAAFQGQDTNANSNRRAFPSVNRPMSPASAIAARIENNFQAHFENNAQTPLQRPQERKRNNSKECNLATAASSSGSGNKNTEKLPPSSSSLRELLESSPGMKESIASLINEYKDKHNHN